MMVLIQIPSGGDKKRTEWVGVRQRFRMHERCTGAGPLKKEIPRKSFDAPSQDDYA